MIFRVLTGFILTLHTPNKNLLERPSLFLNYGWRHTKSERLTTRQIFGEKKACLCLNAFFSPLYEGSY